MFDRQKNGSGPLTTESKSLQDTKQQKQNRCNDPDLSCGRKDTHERRRDTHDEHREGKRFLAPDAIADVTEHHSADGANEKADREGRKRKHGPDKGTLVGEEQLVEDEARGRRIEEEVVPLDRRAEQARGDDGSQSGSPLVVGLVRER